jgi:hypothetical protein
MTLYILQELVFLLLLLLLLLLFLINIEVVVMYWVELRQEIVSTVWQ